MRASFDGSEVVVLAACATSTAVALGGWLVHARRRTRVAGAAPPRPPMFSPMVGLLVGVAALVAVPLGPAVAVFSLVVALNQLLGRGENVPFSVYPMFARPGQRSWSIRFERGSGEAVGTTAFGMIPPVVRRRFSSELDAARLTAPNLLEARRLAAAGLVETLERRRPRTGPLSTETISIVLVEYEFDGEALRSTRTPLAVCPPP